MARRGWLTALCVALLGGGEAAACGNWDVTGRWAINQSNRFNDVALNIRRQNGANFSGFAQWLSGDLREGTVDGKVVGNGVEFTVRWDGGAVGVYRGQIKDTGSVRGETYDATKPSSRATWYTDGRPALCADPPPPDPTYSNAPAPVRKAKSAEEKLKQSVGKAPKLLDAQ